LKPMKQNQSVQQPKQHGSSLKQLTFSPKQQPKGDPSFAKWGLEAEDDDEEQNEEPTPKEVPN
jgi:uncharacterized cupin superfamily protein